MLKRLAPLLEHVVPAAEEKTRLCTAKVKQPCWAGSPYQPIPVDSERLPADRAADHGGAERVPGVTAQPQGVITLPPPYGANPAQVLGYLQPATPQELKKDHLP